MKTGKLEETSVVSILRKAAAVGGRLTIPCGEGAEAYDLWGNGLWDLEAVSGVDDNVDPDGAFVICVTPAGVELLVLLDSVTPLEDKQSRNLKLYRAERERKRRETA